MSCVSRPWIIRGSLTLNRRSPTESFRCAQDPQRIPALGSIISRENHQRLRRPSEASIFSRPRIFRTVLALRQYWTCADIDGARQQPGGRYVAIDSTCKKLNHSVEDAISRVPAAGPLYTQSANRSSRGPSTN